MIKRDPARSNVIQLDQIDHLDQIDQLDWTEISSSWIKLPTVINLLIFMQLKAQSLMKQLHDIYEQSEQTYVEMKTFENLRQHEIGAVPKRLEVTIKDWSYIYNFFGN